MKEKNNYNQEVPSPPYKAPLYDMHKFERFLKHESRKKTIRLTLAGILVVNSLLTTDFGMKAKYTFTDFSKKGLEQVIGKNNTKKMFEYGSNFSDKIINYVKTSLTWVEKYY